MSLPRMTPEQLRRAKALIKKTCCNYDDGYCLVLGCPCPQMHSYSVLCKWFRSAVLPQNEPLYISIEKPHNIKKCVICGKKFIYRSNRAKYCRKCRKTAMRRQKAEYQRNYRQKHK